MQRVIASSIITLSMAASAAQGQHVHGGDIELEVQGGAIVTHGSRVFEAELSAVTGSTSNPGFDSAEGTFAPNASVTLSLLGGLEAWDGSTFVGGGSLGSVTETLQISNANVSVLPESIDTSGIGGNQLTVDADGDGKFHEHFTFKLDAPGVTVPDTGVYRVELSLSTPGVGASLPFWIVFNFNDTEANHADAVTATLATVAVPEPIGLLGAVVPIALLRRRAGANR